MSKLILLIVLSLPIFASAQTAIPNCERNEVVRYTFTDWDFYTVYGPQGAACEEVATKFNQTFSNMDLRKCAELAQQKGMACYQAGQMYHHSDLEGDKCFGCY